MKPLHCRFILCCGVAISTLALVQHAGADSFTIPNGVTAFGTQVLNTPGDVGTVEAGGGISTLNIGIQATADGVTINNAGGVVGETAILGSNNNTITNSGAVSGYTDGISAIDGNSIDNSGMIFGTSVGIIVNDYNTITNSNIVEGGNSGISANDHNTIDNSGVAFGISTSGIYVNDYNTIDNSGTATGAGFAADGITAFDNNTITNSGTAEGTGLLGSGIAARDYNTVTNSGTATGGYTGIVINDGNTLTNSGTATGGFYGITAYNNNTITNSGTVQGGAFGISAHDNNTVTNSGTAQGGGYGIAFNSYNTLTNTGTAQGGEYGIVINNYNTLTNTGIAQSDGYGIGAVDFNTIINSGTISGDTAAVSFLGVDNTLRLQAGSTIIGGLGLGDVSNRLIIDPGLDTALFYNGGTIDTGGQPYVITGSTLYVVNTTGFAAQAGLANDLTRIVAGAVEDRLASARLAGEGLSTRIDGTTVTATADLPAAAQSGVWLSGLGSYRDQKAGSITTDYTTAQGGVVGGFDAVLSENTRAGVFAGLSLARLDDGAGSQDLGSKSYFGGLYLGHDMGQSFVDLSVLAGWMDFDSDRRIANNMVAGGIEHATADYGGFLVSPSLKFGTDMEMGSGILTPSLRLRYTGIVLDGYSESGSSADMVVDGRTVNVVDVRGELAYRFAPVETGGGLLNQTLRVGVDGIFSDAGSIDATLAGQAVGFNVPDGDVVRGFVGYGIDYALASNASLSLSTEAGYDSDEAITFDARAALTLAF